MSPGQKRRGRPSLNPKPRFLGVRVGNEQMEFLSRQAKKHGISMGDFVRGIIENERRRLGEETPWPAFAAKALGLRPSPRKRKRSRGSRS